VANNQALCSTKKERFLPLFFYVYVVRYLCVLSGVFFTLSFLMPNHYIPWLTFYNDFLAALAVTCLFCAYVLREQKISLTLPVFFIFGLAVIPLLQAIFGVIHFFGDAFITSVYLFGFGMAVLLGHCVSANPKDEALKFFAALILFAAMVSVFMALYQWLGLQGVGIWVIDMPPGGRPFANLGQPNNLSTLLCVATASLVYLWERKILGGLTAIVLLIVLIVGLALCQSRTAWLIGGAFFVWWLWKRRTVQLRLGWVPVIGGACCYVLLLSSLTGISEYLGLLWALESGPTEVGARATIWLQLIDAVVHGPIWGYGWNQISLAQLTVVSDYPESIYVADSHNLFLDLMLWNGPILGGALSIVIIYWVLKNAIKCRSLEVWYCLACLAFFLVHSMLELPHTKAYFLLPAGLLIGYVSAENNKLQKSIVSPKWVNNSFVAVGLILLATVFLEYQKIEKDARLIRFEIRKIGVLKAETKAPDVYFLTHLREFLRFGRTKAEPGMSDSEIDWMKQVAHRYPLSSSLFRYTLALAINSRFEEARLEMIRLKNLYGQEDYDEAVANLKVLESEYAQLKLLRQR